MVDEEYLHTKIKELFMTVEQFANDLKDVKLQLDSLKRHNERVMDEWKQKSEFYLKSIEKTNEDFFSKKLITLEAKLSAMVKEEAPVIIGNLKSIEEALVTYEEHNKVAQKNARTVQENMEFLRKECYLVFDVFSKRALKTVLTLEKKNILNQRDVSDIMLPMTERERIFFKRKSRHK